MSTKCESFENVGAKTSVESESHSAAESESGDESGAECFLQVNSSRCLGRVTKQAETIEQAPGIGHKV